MKSRRSVRNQNILFNELFRPAPVKTEKKRPVHLDMTDEQIDNEFFNFGKADRTRMKKEAKHERLRMEVSCK